VVFILTFDASSADTSQASFISTVQTDVATMAGVSVQQVQVAAVSGTLSGRRLLQASSQLQVTVLGSSTTAVQSAYNQFNTAWGSSDANTNPLLAQQLVTSQPLSAQYAVVCADGSSQPTASQCGSNSAAASIATSKIFAAVAVVISLLSAW